MPFQDALTAEQMRQSFEAEGVSFGEDEGSANAGSQPVFTRAVALTSLATGMVVALATGPYAS